MDLKSTIVKLGSESITMWYSSVESQTTCGTWILVLVYMWRFWKIYSKRGIVIEKGIVLDGMITCTWNPSEVVHRCWEICSSSRSEKVNEEQLEKESRKKLHKLQMEQQNSEDQSCRQLTSKSRLHDWKGDLSIVPKLTYRPGRQDRPECTGKPTR